MKQPAKLGFLDVGARGGISSHAVQHRDKLLQVLIEPEPDEAARLQADSQGGTLYRVIPCALGNIDGTIGFNETINPYCSSILKVNHDFLDQYVISEHFAFKQTVSMPCARYDTLYHSQDLPIPHMIKIDVQGFEYQVLQGMGALLQHCLAIELEAHFYPLYRDQKLFHDIVALLADYDFVLRRITNDRNPALNGDFHFEMDIVEINATFTKSRKWSEKQDAAKRDDLNFACSLFDVVANR